MPHDYDGKLHRFYTSSGKPRSRAEMRAQIDKLTDYVKKEARRLAAQVNSGKISADVFEASMRELLKSGHIVAASVGRGGRARMTATDWGRVGNKIKWQYKYLTKFSRKIAKDAISGAASSNRVQLYADALHISYYRSVYADQKDRPQDVPKDKDGKELLVKLVQNSQEGCEDCEADANEGWVRLDEFGLLGSRICGDFCKCDIEFSDE